MCGSGSVFRIRIHKAPEYGSNTEPDPQHCFLPVPYLEDFHNLVVGVGDKLVDNILREEQEELIHRGVSSSCILNIKFNNLVISCKK